VAIYSYGLLVLAVAFAACGETDSPRPIPEGVYGLDSLHINNSGCNTLGADGLSDLDASHLTVFVEDVAGRQITRALSCQSIEDCDMLRAAYVALESGISPSLNFSFQSSGIEGLVGTTQSTGFTSSDGLCRLPERTKTILEETDSGKIGIQSTKWVGPSYPETEDGFCTTDLGAEATKSAPCASMISVSATLVEGR
jgi:hypothetical protein